MSASSARVADRFAAMKKRGEKIAVLTAYDAPTARIFASAGLDLLLVGDSVGTNMLGYASEQDVTLDDMVHHVAAVRRGAPSAAVLADLPFATYDTAAAAVASARRLIDAGADMVKFEGAHLEIAKALADADIAVSGHLGLEPQHHAEKRLKGKTATDAIKLFHDARALDAAGIGLLILELVPMELAAAISSAVSAPTIGIGAGPGTDGQVLVWTDAMGVNDAPFRHNKRFGDIGPALADAARRYCDEVRRGVFPASGYGFAMKPAEADAFRESLSAGRTSAP